ncbi:MAG TPA: FAD-dependent oxidoreductase, partial [Lacipirellulaceae bacterium]|nr:FAD-dependent oxidoreductase [Lacipirellulaceae bacterium]
MKVRDFLLAVCLLLPAIGSSLAASADTIDIVVYGGTSAGVVAAVQAERMGKRVVLVEPSKHLGGLTTGGLGATDIGNKQVIGGLARDFYGRVREYYARDAVWNREK